MSNQDLTEAPLLPSSSLSPTSERKEYEPLENGSTQLMRAGGMDGDFVDDRGEFELEEIKQLEGAPLSRSEQ